MRIISGLLAISFLILANAASGQTIQKVVYDSQDSAGGYYLAIPPTTGIIRGTVVLFCPFGPPESMLPETKLHNVAAANDLLTIYVSTGGQFIPNATALQRMNQVLEHVADHFKVDTSLFAIGGFDLAGFPVLAYTEQAQERPSEFAVHPKVVFCVASYVDLEEFYTICQRQVKRNYFPPAVGDAKFFINAIEKELGSPNPGKYAGLSPFSSAATGPGKEKWLRHTALRLYYDTDINWHLKARGNGYNDTYLVDGAEMINRLLLSGNDKAEFMAARQPGMRSNGNRHANALSIVDETDCIQWIKGQLHIFSPNNPFAYQPPYKFDVPEGWRIERSAFPAPFEPKGTLHGVEEIRFPPGWGIAGKEDYWSLAYLFWLDGGQKINEEVLKENLTIYYDGLVTIGGGAVPHNIPADKLFPTVVNIKKIKAEPGDVETYTGTVSMLDYMAMKPMILNFKAHLKTCNRTDHFPLFLELSPKPFTDVIWNDLEKMQKNFKCGE